LQLTVVAGQLGVSNVEDLLMQWLKGFVTKRPDHEAIFQGSIEW